VSLKDYAHHNEDADHIWWAEEGRHTDEPEYDPDDYLPEPDDGDWDEEEA
jgi:hypothetical protein